LHDIAEEHERLAAVALQGDTDVFRRELAQHFASALGPHTQERGKAPISTPEHPRWSVTDIQPPTSTVGTDEERVERK
jgi:hypothetical protein